MGKYSVGGGGTDRFFILYYLVACIVLPTELTNFEMVVIDAVILHLGRKEGQALSVSLGM